MNIRSNHCQVKQQSFYLPGREDPYFLEYEECGAIYSDQSLSAVPVVFLHGINSGASSWHYQQLALQDTHHMIYWDMPGYGLSSVSYQTPLADDYADILYHFLQAKGISQCILVGHSLGALIAYAYSQKYAAHLKGLFLASVTQGYGDQSLEIQEKITTMRPNLYREHGKQAYLEENLQRLASTLKDERYDIVKYVISKITLEGISASSYLLGHSRLLDYEHEVTVPFHVVCGDLDQITPFENVKALSQKLGAAFSAIPNAGHPCYLENDHSFNIALQLFINQCLAD